MTNRDSFINTPTATEFIVTSNYVKYNKLDQLIAHAYAGSDATSINLYIDLYGIMRTLLSRSYRTNISEYTTYTSAVINMCGHYRAFFKYLGVHTNIYLISSYNCCEYNSKLVAGYNQIIVDKCKNTPVRDMIEQNNQLLKALTPFLPDIYFLETDFESSVLIDYLIRHGDGNPNIIISKDIYPCQLTYLHANTSYIKPKKFNGEDLSVIIPPRENIAYLGDFWFVYGNTKGMKSNAVMERLTMIHPINFTMLGALHKFDYRSMSMIYNITQSTDLISKAVGNNPIPVHTDAIVNVGLYRGRGKKREKIEMPEQVILNRHHALDVSFMRSVYDDSVESKMINCQNLTDDEAVRSICATYFADHPIDLGRL